MKQYLANGRNSASAGGISEISLDIIPKSGQCNMNSANMKKGIILNRLNKQFSKEEILKMYISSVRYEKGVLGLANAIKYFFGDIHKKELSNEEAFFLVERLSNITSKVKWDRIKHLAPRTALQIEDIKLERIYKGLIENGKLKEE